jgi:hypothetical protein
MKVIEALLPVGHPNRPGIKLLGIKARVWHGTANLDHKATDTANVGYAGRKYVKKWNKVRSQLR